MSLLGGLFGGGKSTQGVWGPQGSYLTDLYSRALPATVNFAGQAGNYAQGLQQQGQGPLNSLAMMSQIGNPFVQQQLGQLGQGFGQLFQNYINPAINSEYQISGTAGGSRQGIAQGLAAGQLGQQFGNAATDLLAQSGRQAIGAAGVYGNLGQTLQNIGFQGALGPWQALAGILGTGPTGTGKSVQNPNIGDTLGGIGGLLTGLAAF